MDSNHRIGTLLVLASCLPFALAGIFTKAIEADLWTVLAWRGLLGGAVIAAYALRYEGRAPMGRAGWALALVGAAGSVAYLGAFRLAPVANVALIYALAPFAAAGLSWLIGAPLGGRGVLVAAAISVAGVALMVGGGAGGHGAGNALALLMTGLMALMAVLIRARPQVPALRAMAASALPLAAAGLAFGAPLSGVSARDAALMTGFAASFALSVILLTEGSRRLPAAQVALFGGAEAPLTIALAALLLREFPPLATLGGGVLILGAVAWQSGRSLRKPPS